MLILMLLFFLVILPLDCLTIMGLDWTGPITLIILFVVSHFNLILFHFTSLYFNGSVKKCVKKSVKKGGKG